MAEVTRMTADEVVSYFLEGEGVDVLRESLLWVCQQLMQAELSELVGPGRGERAPEERLTHRNGYRLRPWQTRAGEIELAIAQIRRGSYLPSFLEPRRRSEQGLVSVVQEAYVAGISTRKVDQLVESLGLRTRRARCRASARLGRAGGRLPQPPARGALPVPLARGQGREGPGWRPCRPQVPGARLRGARVGLPRGDRPTSASARRRPCGAASCARSPSAAFRTSSSSSPTRTLA